MKLLIDANIILEVILERKRGKEARELLGITKGYEFFITDYALHSIGTFLFKLNKKSEFKKLLQDLIKNNMKVLLLQASELESLTEFSDKFQLDFDDAYQYTVAQKHDLNLVSFDKDFDKTERGRKTPMEILQ